MASNVLRFLQLMLLSLLVGTMFGIWVGFDPAGLSAAAYIEEQQNAIRSLNTLLPVMGAVCILLTVTLAVLTTGDPRSRYLLVAAAALMFVVAFITRLENQPINAIVATWKSQFPAANWADLRDQWWHWHIIRSVAGLGALALAILSVLATKGAVKGGAA